MESAAHPYKVQMEGHCEEENKADGEEENKAEREEEREEDREKEQRERLPRRFDEMPRDAQWLVLKHTGARFVVTGRSRAEQAQLLLPYTFFWPYYVPVIVHYEFRLLPLRASGPEMIARFTLHLDPAIQQLPEWRFMSTAHQALFLDGRAWLAREFEPFSELRVQELHARDDTNQLFCFLFCFLCTSRHRLDASAASSVASVREIALPWSKFDEQVLMEVRDRMQTVFRLQLQHL
jgi:hypothetical protein